MNLLYVAIGGAVGALMRYGVTIGSQQLWGKAFPYGTLIVNILGSFVIGVVYVLMVERSELPQECRAFLVIGLLGAFTTFSTFSFETITLFEIGDSNKAFINIFSNVFTCLAVCWLGMALARQTSI